MKKELLFDSSDYPGEECKAELDSTIQYLDSTYTTESSEFHVITDMHKRGSRYLQTFGIAHKDFKGICDTVLNVLTYDRICVYTVVSGSRQGVLFEGTYNGIVDSFTVYKRKNTYCPKKYPTFAKYLRVWDRQHRLGVCVERHLTKDLRISK